MKNARTDSDLFANRTLHCVLMHFTPLSFLIPTPLSSREGKEGGGLIIPGLGTGNWLTSNAPKMERVVELYVV